MFNEVSPLCLLILTSCTGVVLTRQDAAMYMVDEENK
jgi:hypothetical protein